MSEWKQILRDILIVKVVSLGLGGFFCVVFSTPHPASMDRGFFDIWYQWDALRYLQIASQGYLSQGSGAENIAFYPLFPYSIRAVASVAGATEIIGMILAQIYSVAGLLVFYALASKELGPEKGRMSLWALMLFPTAYFFHLPYTEGLFLLCAAGSFYSARSGRWQLAGVAGAAAVLTRIHGMCLFPALMLEFVLSRRQHRQSWLKMGWLFLLPMAIMIYLLINKNVTGYYFGFLEYQSNFWHRDLVLPWEGIRNKIRVLSRTGNIDYWFNVTVMELAAVSFLLIATLRSFFKDRWSYAVYALGVTWLCISTGFILSVPRYILCAFPLFLLHPPLDRRNWITGCGLAIMVIGYMFYLARYMIGRWAF